MKLDLNVFTNFCAPAVAEIPLFQEVPRLLSTFGRAPFDRIRIFCDPGPLQLPVQDFLAQCRATPALAGAEVFTAHGLADGYVQSIQRSDADFVFQLEHDWQLVPELLHHSFTEICARMRAHKLPWLVFNRYLNEGGSPPHVLLDFPGFPVCRSTYFTNCPHILDRKHAAEHLVPFIDLTEIGSRGIERELTCKYGQGWIYGPLTYPPVSIHADGKALNRAWRRSSLSRRLLEIHWKTRRRIRDRLGLTSYGKIGDA